MVRKEFRQVFRDRPMVFIIFLVPLFQLLILAHALTVEVRHLKLLVVDLDDSAESRTVVQAFSHTERFDVVGHSGDPGGIRTRMQSWQAQMALVIPARFGRQLRRGLVPQLQLVVDGVDGNSAGVAMGYAQGILAGVAQELGRTAAGAPGLAPVRLATMEEQMWYNPELSSRQFMVPGIVVVLLTILPMMLSALSLVKEKEIGTLEQLLVTPLRKHQLLAGKLAPFLILSYVELGLVTTVAVLGFAIPMQGSYLLLAALALLYLFTTLGLGIFVSALAHSQQQAMFVAWFFMIFMILMSGFFVPIHNMPAALQALTYLNPMRYFMAIVRDLFQKGSALPDLWPDVLPMAAFGLGIFSFGVAAFRKRVG
jgi:ABC-2 type transport system permease protein